MATLSQRIKNAIAMKVSESQARRKSRVQRESGVSVGHMCSSYRKQCFRVLSTTLAQASSNLCSCPNTVIVGKALLLLSLVNQVSRTFLTCQGILFLKGKYFNIPHFILFSKTTTFRQATGTASLQQYLNGLVSFYYPENIESCLE